MGHIYKKVEEMIGGTPLLELEKIEREEGLKARVLVKLELFNPAGSVKDRAALFMILDAEERGLLHPGDTIISRRPSGLRKTIQLCNSLAHRTTWLRSDLNESKDNISVYRMQAAQLQQKSEAKRS